MQRGGSFTPPADRQRHGFAILLLQFGAQLKAALEGDVFERAADDRVGMLLEGVALRLEETWMAALQRRIDVDLRLGHHLDLIGELRELLAEHPLYEDLWLRLMIAAWSTKILSHETF